VRVTIASDSFKGSLSAIDVCRAVEMGILRVNPSVETVLVPMADGGEGTVECLVYATKGTFVEAVATNPLGKKINSKYGVLGDGRTCVIDVASASGLTLLNPNEYAPLRTTSFGTGELILDALNRGYRRFIVGLGGSATNDMGAGILQALGARILNKDGQQISFGGGSLHEAVVLDMSDFDPRIQESEFIIASDVINPLVGPTGASMIFGPQKGATAEMVRVLDRNLEHFADLILDTTGLKVHHHPGGGAAGGIGAMFHAFFPGHFERGIELVMKVSDLRNKMIGASLVITGEGKLDAQTQYGKVPRGVAEMARQLGIPTIALVGSVGTGSHELRKYGIASVVSIINAPMTLQDAMSSAFEMVSDTAEQVFRIYTLHECTGEFI
jgi:glycerate 2-kinase